VISESRTTENMFQFCLLFTTCLQSKSRLVTKRKQNDVTLLNTFLLIVIVIFAKTNFGHVTRCLCGLIANVNVFKLSGLPKSCLLIN